MEWIEIYRIYSFFPVKPRSLRILPNVKTYTVREGIFFAMNCSAVGNPTPTITWRSSSSDSFAGNTISFRSTNRRDGKDYTCIASNSVGSITKTITVIVQCELLLFFCRAAKNKNLRTRLLDIIFGTQKICNWISV